MCVNFHQSQPNCLSVRSRWQIVKLLVVSEATPSNEVFIHFAHNEWPADLSLPTCDEMSALLHAHASHWYKNIFVNRMHSRNTEYSVRRRSKNIICQSFYSFILIALKCRLTHWSQTHSLLKMHSKTNANVKYFKENVCSSAPHFNGFIKSSSNFICEECNLRFPSFFILFSYFLPFSSPFIAWVTAVVKQLLH